MATYIVSYDLAPDGDYQSLYAELKAKKVWARVTESTWVIVTDESAAELRDRLTTVMDDKDRLFVVKSGVEAAWRNARCKNEWLKKWL